MLDHCDNFEIYGGNAGYMLDGVFAQRNATMLLNPDPTGTGEYVAAFTSSLNACCLRYVYRQGAVTTPGFAGRFYLSSLPQGYVASFLQLRDAGNAAQLTFSITTTGQIQVRRGFEPNAFGGGGGAVIATSALPVVTAHAWHHVEVMATIHDTAGAIEVRVNAVPVDGLVLTDLDTKATATAGCSQIVHSNGQVFGATFDSSGATSIDCPTLYMKDYIVYSDAGDTINDFLGTVIVLGLRPDSDVSSGWTPSSGSDQYALIDEAPPNDAGYISAGSPPPAAAILGFENLPDDVTSVRALMTMVRARKVDGGDGNLQVSLISNGDTGDGADRPITTAQTYWRDNFERDPDTAAAWTPAGVDAARLKLNRTT
jgi:hypothetical protein